MGIQNLLGKIDYYTRPFKPLLLLQMAVNSYRRRNQSETQLDTLDISMSFDCNMTCEHCSAQVMSNPTRERLTLEDYSRLTDELDRLHVFRLNITGGEPLLADHLEHLLQVLRPYKRHIKVQTNGLLLTEERIVSLKRAGANAISMSLDSVDEAEFDRFRGVPGGFKKIMANIDLIRKHRLQVSLACVVTHESLQNGGTERVIEFAQSHKCHLLLNLAIPVGRWANREEFLLDREGHDRKKVEALVSKYPHVHTDHDASGCPAATRKIYLTPYGDVIPCPFLHVSFGNVREESLLVIRERMLHHYRYSGSPFCPAAEDPWILENWLKPSWDASQLPLNYQNLPD